MSASSTPTEAPSATSARARFAALHRMRDHLGADAHRDAAGARRLERLGYLAADRLVLALARIAELDVEGHIASGELDVARRAGAEEILAGIRIYDRT